MLKINKNALIELFSLDYVILLLPDDEIPQIASSGSVLAVETMPSMSTRTGCN
jgi:hypothetical protein